MNKFCSLIYPKLALAYKYIFYFSIIFLFIRTTSFNITIDNWSLFDATFAYLVILPIVSIIMQVSGFVIIVFYGGLIKVFLNKKDSTFSDNIFFMWLFGFVVIPLVFFFSFSNKVPTIEYVILAIIIPSIYTIITHKCEEK